MVWRYVGSASCYAFLHVQALENYDKQLDIIYGIIMHEIIHALGFSSRMFDK